MNMASDSEKDDGMAPEAHDDEFGDPEIAFSSAELSEDERKEILAKINGIVEKRRSSLSQDINAAPGKRFKAKKHGGLFPILVNVLAVLILAGGFLALYSFQADVGVQAREGTRVFTDVERTLIEEIRRETNALLAAKDMEIAMILASLADIEMQIQELMAGGGELSQEQLDLQAHLRAMYEERQSALTEAREDRVRILYEARLREVAIQAQVDARLREFDNGAAAGIRESYAADLEAAREELARLAREQDLAMRMESQVAGLFANVQRQVAEGNFDGAAGTVEGLQLALGGSDFQGLRGMQTRRELYALTTQTLEILIASASIVMNGTAGSIVTQAAESARLIAQLEDSIADLRLANEALGQEMDERDDIIRELQEQNDLQEQSITVLNTQLAQVRLVLQALTQ